MNVIINRQLGFLLVGALLSMGSVFAQAATQVEVFKNPSCGCCGKWVEYLQKQGFKVTTHPVSDVAAVRAASGIPAKLSSCHTARIGGYSVEGHVPAADIQRLLKEKPKAIGLAVPAMPPGSPGMETTTPAPFDTLLVMSDGSTRVFARH